MGQIDIIKMEMREVPFRKKAMKYPGMNLMRKTLRWEL